MTGPQSEPDLVVRDVDWSVWVPAPPPPWVADFPQTDEEWAAEYAVRVFARAGLRPRKRQLTVVRQQLLIVGNRGYPDPDTCWIWKALHLVTPDQPPVPAVIAILPPVGTAEDDLGAMARVGDPTLVEPPVVEEIVTPLGTGIRSQAYASARNRYDDAELIATLTCAWRVDGPQGPQNVRLWMSYSPDRVIAASEDFDRLARCLHPAATRGTA